jgi:hypothetical protein
MELHDMKTKKKALRLDRRLEASHDVLPVLDLEILHRSFRESLLGATLFRRPPRYLRGPSGARR